MYPELDPVEVSYILQRNLIKIKWTLSDLLNTSFSYWSAKRLQISTCNPHSQNKILFIVFGDSSSYPPSFSSSSPFSSLVLYKVTFVVCQQSLNVNITLTVLFLYCNTHFSFWLSYFLRLCSRPLSNLSSSSKALHHRER